MGADELLVKAGENADLHRAVVYLLFLSSQVNLATSPHLTSPHLNYPSFSSSTWPFRLHAKAACARSRVFGIMGIPG